ncbi:hypothetical protein FMN50_15230 [Rhodobacterales bacterium]|nr:hypothetical protein FMN50_15230 [Rhodobacterales bacterium]
MIGGILVLGGGFGLYSAGLIKLPAEQNQQMANAVSAAEDKIAELENRLDEAGAGAGAAAQDVSNSVSALEQKVSELEGKLQDAGTSSGSGAPEGLDDLRSEVDALRSQVEASSNGSGAAAGGDGAPANLQPLEDRIAALESETSSSTSEADKLTGSVSGLETEFSDLKKQIGDLQTRLENTEATAKAAQTAVSTSDVSLKTLADSQARATETLSSLSADIKSVGAANTSALEDIRAEMKSLSARLEQVESTMGDATARELAARALSVSALKSAVDSGRPYRTELAAVKAGLPSDMDLSALESHAESGVEPTAVLIAQFPPVAREMFQTFATPDETGDVFDNLLASARSIVAIRGPGDEDGTGPQATLRRMETAVSNGDLETALTAYKALPEKAQAAGAEWAKKAEARVEVDTLTDKASQEVLNALGAKDS